MDLWLINLITPISLMISIILVIHYKSKSFKFEPEEIVKSEITKIARRNSVKVKKLELEPEHTVLPKEKRIKELENQLEAKQKELNEVKEILNKLKSDEKENNPLNN